MSRLRTWPSCRDQEWTRRPGASPPMRMTASWSDLSDRPNTSLWRDRSCQGRAPLGLSSLTNLGHRKACGYVDDRLRRPAPLPPLPEQARKPGKCSLSPTYPQAPQPMRELISMGNIRCGFGDGPKRIHVKSLDTKSPIQVRARRVSVNSCVCRLRGSPVPPVVLAVRNDIQTAGHPVRHIEEGDRLGEVEDVLVPETLAAQPLPVFLAHRRRRRR